MRPHRGLGKRYGSTRALRDCNLDRSFTVEETLKLARCLNKTWDEAARERLARLHIPLDRRRSR